MDDSGRRAAQSLRAEGIDAEHLEIDITDTASVDAARKEIDARHGRLDILVNNARILPEAAADSLTVPLALKMFRPTFETNVLGTVAVIEAMLPLLRRADAGRILNVSSSLGSLSLQTDPEWPSYQLVVPAYQASKAALNAITIALAKLLADTPITVNAVCPGFVQTDIHPPTNRSKASLSAGAAGEFVARVALDSDAGTGRFIDRDGILPW